jgi:hypothetical protein
MPDTQTLWSLVSEFGQELRRNTGTHARQIFGFMKDQQSSILLLNASCGQNAREQPSAYAARLSGTDVELLAEMLEVSFEVKRLINLYHNNIIQEAISPS